MITRNYLKNLEQKKLINVFVVTAKILKTGSVLTALNVMFV
tara:strand:+ start:611 stop:733 length:123 start_codon:yes stop_codon:yes gene_type:complete